MLSSAFKLLLPAIVLVCVTAETHHMDIEVPETKENQTDNVEMDDLVKKEIKKPAILTPFVPICPFDCSKVCIVKYPFTWGIPPVSYVFYRCHIEPYECCKKACCYYKTCVNSNKPAWACYTDTLDKLCKCRSIAKPNIKFKIKGKKGK